jgi:hypothetical protein
VTTIETEPHPTELPPDSGAGAGNGARSATTVEPPREIADLTSDLIAEAAGAGTVAAEPSLHPGAAAAADGIGLWQTGKQVDALYSTYAARFSWMHVSGGQWRRFSPVSDSGVAALALLAAHARDRGRPVNYREEADQFVHEMYVW